MVSCWPKKQRGKKKKMYLFVEVADGLVELLLAGNGLCHVELPSDLLGLTKHSKHSQKVSTPCDFSE
jgi:hypothetical protein